MTKQELREKNLETIIEMAQLDNGRITSIIKKDNGQLSINIKFENEWRIDDFKNRAFRKGVMGTYMKINEGHLQVDI